MRDRRLLVGLGVVSALAAAVVVLVLLTGSPSTPSPSAAESSTAAAAPSAAPAFGGEDASRLQDALGSGDPARVATVISRSPSDQIDDGFAAQLAAANLRIDAASFTPGERGTATVEASTTVAGVAARWLLILTSVSGQWQLSATAKIS